MREKVRSATELEAEARHQRHRLAALGRHGEEAL